jgi:ABC-type polar amino acid transport system ATPase subunit
LACQPKALKGGLRKWNEDIFGDVGKRKMALLECIRELDVIGEGRVLVEEEKVRKEDFARELEKFSL